jgi:hypothetical protein
LSVEGTVFDDPPSTASNTAKLPTQAAATDLLLSPTALTSLTRAFAKFEKTRQMTEAERIGQSVGAIGGVLKKGSLTFLDQRRFNNIAIKLTQIRMTNEAIKQAVLTVDLTVLTPERTKKLLLCAPNGDDLESIRPYDGDPDMLAQVERFFYDVQHVSCFEARLCAIDAYHRLRMLSGDAMGMLETITHACTNVLTSPHLSRLLRTVLAVGNTLNRGTTRGNYHGYRLEILTKLAFVKSTNPGGTDLMRWLADQAFASPHGGEKLVASLAEAADSVRRGGIVSWDKVEGTVRKIEKVPDIVSRSVTSVASANAKKDAATFENDDYEAQMSTLVQHVQQLVATLQRRVAMSRHLYQQCASFLGASGDKPGALFGILGKFIVGFLDAHNKNMLAAERAMRKARLEQLEVEAVAERKQSKRMRVQKMSMYPRVFKMLGFARGRCPPRNGLAGGRKGGRKWARGWRRPNHRDDGKGAENEDGQHMMNELERMMEKRRLRRLNKESVKAGGGGLGGGGTGSGGAAGARDNDSGERNSGVSMLRTNKGRGRNRQLFRYHPAERLSELRVFGNRVDFGVHLGCENAWHRLEDDSDAHSSITWCLFEFVKAAQGEYPSVNWALVPREEGSGGLAGMNAFLKGETEEQRLDHSDAVLFGGFRVDAIDERENVVSKRCKLVHVTFFGENVKAKLRSIASMHRGHIAEVCIGFHASMHAAGVGALLEEKEVESVLLSATGSHKPTRFDFF